ncbi:TIGR02530 family flagellar biosynthesis protein [Paenibacillus phoenicis]|uniref:TIGR02530 family flagellar biosynthesis protein n=1 Tax=Paenibacillus phoenicis TaxID=554117 RepID=A0ABU5PHC4_9BACL|nr:MULTISPECIES: TIGR02530 family flagellar biosynthesis protein [Paenibacillus]MCT2196717.1 flagellar biosynthesis protein [Paenibacillus sp. p3-SID1389]MEA3569275.1 TIGR02530 family flagellar biosynthesis protein [Paenibacillus phoenicis]
MNEPIRVGQLYAGRIGPNALTATKSTPQNAVGSNFKEMLEDRLVHFSNHAVKRLEQRGIELKPEQLNKIESAIDSAAAKGAKDSLILLKDMALIVNVHNRTVVTAMDGSSMKDNVFTQIDSAVIIS